jgi:prepilin signal peptidase PulO-like enzyme (type II secretory pathway)
VSAASGILFGAAAGVAVGLSASLLGAVLGWLDVSAAATGLLVAFALGGGWALVCLLRGRSRRAVIAFGPFLIAGWALELVMGAGLAPAG